MIYFYVSLVTYACFCLIKFRESLYYLMKDKYEIKKYGKRIYENINNIFINPELISFVLIIIALACNVKTIGICTVITYTILFLYKLKTNNQKYKINKKLTLRIIVILLIYLLINIWFCIDYKTNHDAEIIFDNTALYYIVLIIMA